MLLWGNNDGLAAPRSARLQVCFSASLLGATRSSVSRLTGQDSAADDDERSDMTISTSIAEKKREDGKSKQGIMREYTASVVTKV